MHTIDGPWNFKLKARKADKLFWQSWEHDEGPPKVQCDANVCLAGHSFGAATLVRWSNNSHCSWLYLMMCNLAVVANKPPSISGQTRFQPSPCQPCYCFGPLGRTASYARSCSSCCPVVAPGSSWYYAKVTRNQL